MSGVGARGYKEDRAVRPGRLRSRLWGRGVLVEQVEIAARFVWFALGFEDRGAEVEEAGEGLG